MGIKRIFIVISAIFAVSTVFADNSSVTSKKYVDDLMSGYQGKLPGSGANTLMIYDNSEDGIGEKSIEATLGENATGVPTVGAVKTGLDGVQDTITGTAGYVMTGTGYDGSVGEKPIYGTSSRYNSALVTAETVNTAVTNAVNGSLVRVDENGNQSNTGTLWEIQDDLVALNICSNYTPATGTGVQNGTPTPTNPILPTFYQDGDMILRRVGEYTDSYDATTNKITRRVGVKVLDGTETWNKGTNTPQQFFTILPNQQSSSTGYSTHFIYAGSLLQMGTGKFLIGNSVAYFIRDNNDATLTINDWKQWLAAQYAAGTPVVVYYPLATPVTEDMPPRCQ